MRTRLQVFFVILLAVIGNTGIVNASTQAPLISGSSLVSSTVCPAEGCAAGQRLNFNVQFALSSLAAPEGNPNVMACFYTPHNWSVNSLAVTPKGDISQADYTPDTSECILPSTLVDYDYLGRVTAQVDPVYTEDSLRFAFRLGAGANSNGSLIVRTFGRTGSTEWKETTGSGTPLGLIVKAAAATAYVANDRTSCNNNSPCYVNSDDDLADGIGTGLKDAIDSSPSKIIVLGNYTIKSNAVKVSRQVTLQGLNDASITYSGSTCSQPILDLTAGAILQNLTINAGGCSHSRTLIVVDTADHVVIESNDLTGGSDAIASGAVAANLTVRFNQISDNSGDALNLSQASSGSQVFATANNLSGNGSGSAQVECSGAGSNVVLDHNFWGAGILPSETISNCQPSVNNSMRLGAAILQNATSPGVAGHEINVTEFKTYSPENAVAFQHPSGEPNFNIYLINHGANGTSSIPFQNTFLSACSNYWDLFLGQRASTSSSLDVYLKYGLNNVCMAAVESPSYCGRSTPYVPLWWYDLGSNQWLMTAAQKTTCDTGANELKVTLDGSGTPVFPGSLSFTPFVVGLENLPSSVVLTQFTATAGNASVSVVWQTSSEQNTSGFYLQRATSTDGTFVTLPSNTSPQLFSSQGTSSSGATYTYSDYDVANGTTYFYRLELINHDGGLTAFGSAQATPMTFATATPTPTITSTATNTTTVTPTITLTRTVTPTMTRTPTRTPTKTFTPTYTPYRSPTPYRTSTPTRTPTLSGSRTPTLSGSRTPVPTTGSGYPGSESTTTSGTQAPTTKTATVAGGTSNPSTSDGSGYAGGTTSSTAMSSTQTGGTKATIAVTKTGNPTGANQTPQETVQSTKTPASVKPASGADLWRNLGIGGLIATLLVSIAGSVLFVSRGTRL